MRRAFPCRDLIKGPMMRSFHDFVVVTITHCWSLFHGRPPHIPLKAGDRRANWWKCDKVADTSLSVAEMLKAPGDEEAQQIRGLTKDIVHLGKIPIEREENTHYDDVIMSAIASQITSLTIVYSIVYSDQSKHQSSASLAFVWGIHRGPRWIPRTNGQLRGKCFHLMTSSCHRLPL